MEARQEFESNLNMAKVTEEFRRLSVEDEEKLDGIAKSDKFVKSKATTDDFVKNKRVGLDDDIRMKVMEKMSNVVHKRENVMTAEEYCQATRTTNEKQRNLILEAIQRNDVDGERQPLQIFLIGPAGCGKTFTMKLLMEKYNRFAQAHNVAFNSYMATASTGMSALCISVFIRSLYLCFSSVLFGISGSMKQPCTPPFISVTRSAKLVFPYRYSTPFVPHSTTHG